MDIGNYKKTDNHWQQVDRQMMARALRLAKKGQYTARPNPIVGCVIVKDGQVIGEGWHQTFGKAHAEVNALNVAGEKAKDAVCYVTLEPCAHTGKTGPCAEALVKAGVKKVIAAMADPNPLVAGKGFDILKNAGIEVEYGLLESSAISLNPGFISRMTRQRPWVTCKLAMSLDGRTALASGISQWITGPAARADVQKLRAKQDAIITGVGTLLADNPSLTVRKTDTQPELDPWFDDAQKYGFKLPARVVLDKQAKAPLNSKLFDDNAESYWFVDPECAKGKAVPSWVSVVDYSGDIEEVFAHLYQQGCANLLVEAGHRMAGAFLNAGLIDELVVYMAPKLMGNQGMGLLDLSIDSMDKVKRLNLKDFRKVGDDIRLTYEVV